MSTNRSFIVLITGQIDYGQFPLIDNIYCKFSYVYGSDWRQIAGIEEGISAKCVKGTRQDKIVVGLPLEATFTSTNPYGWPQICISCYGLDCFGNDVPRGYGAIHLPTAPGRKTLRIPMFVPEASTIMQKWLGWITGRRAEFIEPRIVAYADGRQATKVRTQGFIYITLNTVLKDIKKLGYDVQSDTFAKYSHFPLPDFNNKERQMPEIRQTIHKKDEIQLKDEFIERQRNDYHLMEPISPNSSTGKLRTEEKISSNSDLEIKNIGEKNYVRPLPLPTPLPRIQPRSTSSTVDDKRN